MVFSKDLLSKSCYDLDVACASRCTDSTRRHMHPHTREARIIETDARTSTHALFYVTIFIRVLAQASSAGAGPGRSNAMLAGADQQAIVCRYSRLAGAQVGTGVGYYEGLP